MELLIDQLDVRYGSRVALERVTTRIGSGAITAVLGPNASGKSTLLKSISGFLRPTSGSVMLDGMRTDQMDGPCRARKIAYVPQRSIPPGAMTVNEVVQLARFASVAGRHRIEEVLARLHLEPIAGRPMQELSVGQAQRVTLARALVQHEPGQCLLLDEPFSAMDMVSQELALQLLQELAGQGSMVILCLHQLELARSVASAALILKEGRVLHDGPVESVIQPEVLEQVYGVRFMLLEPGGIPMPCSVARGPDQADTMEPWESTSGSSSSSS